MEIMMLFLERGIVVVVCAALDAYLSVANLLALHCN